MDQNSLKQMVADEAVKFIKDGMVVGLGSGSTIRLMVDALGQRVKAENLKITCVSTSKYTANQARELGMLVKESMKLRPLTSRLMVLMKLVMILTVSKAVARPTCGRKLWRLILSAICGLSMKASWFINLVNFRYQLK